MRKTEFAPPHLLAVVLFGAALAALGASVGSAEEGPCDLASCDAGGCDGGGCCDAVEDGNWGPCWCRPRKTLLQWSYGTSFGGGAPGYDEPLATDRPDFTEASVTVGRGVAQIETGYTYVFDREGGDRTITDSYPEALLRVGVLAEWLEFRIAYNYLREESRVGGVTSVARGSDDLYLGFKIALTPQECWLPEMAIIPQAFVPTGSAAFTADETLPGLNWIYAWELSDTLSLGGSTQGNRRVDDAGEFYFEVAQSAVLGVGLSDAWGAYFEWFALVPNGATVAEVEHFFDGGLTWLVNNNIQLDVRAGVGLTGAADDYFTGVGYSQRF